MFEIQTMYAGQEINVTAETEREAMSLLRKEKRGIQKAEEDRKRACDMAYRRAHEAIGRIAQMVQRKADEKTCHWALHVPKTEQKSNTFGQTKYKFSVSNADGFASLQWDEAPKYLLEAPDGAMGVFDMVSNLWLAVGICDGQTAFLDVPAMLISHFESLPIYTA